jgi:hypothetical protein
MGLRAAGLSFEHLEARMLFSGALPHAAATAMAYDAAGVLHVAYYDSVKQNLKYATRAVNGTWSPITTVDAGTGAGVQLALALDSQGRPAVAYYDAALKGLKYAQRLGSKWTIATIDAQRRVGLSPSLAFDSADHPLVSYSAGASQDLRLAAFSGRRWSVQTIDATGNVGRFSSIAVNPADGAWAIAYESAGTHQIKIATRHKRTFSIGVIDTLNAASGWASKPSLAFDSNDVPAVSYGDPAHDAIVLARAGRKRWNMGIAASGGNIGADNTLSFDSQSASPRIVYLDLAGGLNLASFDGSTWSAAALGTSSCATAAESPVTHLFSFLNGQDIADRNLALGAPSNFVAMISFDDPTWINLHWDDNSAGESGYRIERSDDGINFSTIDILPADTVDFDDASVVFDHTYHYRVTPFDNLAAGLTSAAATVTSAAAAPINVHAVAIDAGRIDLTWTNVSTTADWIEIHCTQGGNIFTVNTDVDPTATSYSVTEIAGGLPLSADAVYSFWVTAQRADGNDGLVGGSSGATATTGFAAPSNLFFPTAASDQITLTWGDVLGESGYELEWSTDNSNFTLLAATAADVTEYTLTGLTENTPYYFRIRALSELGNTAFSAVSMTSTLLATPTNVVATALPGGQFQLTWDDVSTSETNYVVEVAQEAGAWTLPLTLPAGSNSCIITEGPYGVPQAGLHYRFSVRALIFAGGASSRGVSSAVAALA